MQYYYQYKFTNLDFKVQHFLTLSLLNWSAQVSFDLPQIDHVYVATVLQRQTKLRDEQLEIKFCVVDLFHLQEFKSD